MTNSTAIRTNKMATKGSNPVRRLRANPTPILAAEGERQMSRLPLI
jgi:hypothetical protein